MGFEIGILIRGSDSFTGIFTGTGVDVGMGEGTDIEIFRSLDSDLGSRTWIWNSADVDTPPPRLVRHAS